MRGRSLADGLPTQLRCGKNRYRSQRQAQQEGADAADLRSHGSRISQPRGICLCAMIRVGVIPRNVATRARQQGAGDTTTFPEWAG
jgi:hypothetical protein